jgi:hypothetical protein
MRFIGYEWKGWVWWGPIRFQKGMGPAIKSTKAEVAPPVETTG